MLIRIAPLSVVLLATIASHAAAVTPLLPMRRLTDRFLTPHMVEGAVEFQLHESRDGGQNWDIVDRQPATERFFTVDPKQPGVAWYSATATLADGSQQPSQLTRQLQIEWDNSSPRITLARSVSPGGWVDLECRVNDNRLGPTHGLTIEYLAGDDPDWKPIPLTSPPNQVSPGTIICQTRWQPQFASRVVYLRATARDLAGNRSRHLFTLFLPPRSLRRSTPPQPNAAAVATPGAIAWEADNQASPEPLTPAQADPGRTSEPPPLFEVNSYSFPIAYQLDPQRKVVQVQLWGSMDGGRTLSHWGNDQDLRSPLQVRTNRDGLHGFRVITIYQTPRAGENARGEHSYLWVRVKATRP